MIGVLNAWHETKKEQEEAKIEYMPVDFYGPVVTFKLERYRDVSVFRAFPLNTHTENAGYSMSDLNLLKSACKEIFQKYGKFILCLALFEVLIDCEEAAEDKIEEKLLNIRLF